MRRRVLVSYHALGGLRGAIGQRAQNLLEELRQTDGEGLNTALSQVFEGLVQLSGSGKASRRKASRDEFMAAPRPIPQLVEKLIFPGRLLLAEHTGGRATVTLAHEALLQEWPDLQNWLGLDALELLRKGAGNWNSWRAKEALILPKLSGADLSGLDLQGADLHGMELSGANLTKSHLGEANLLRANLNRANLHAANLNCSDSSGANLGFADLSASVLRGANLEGAILSGANLRGVDLSEASLREADLSGSNLQQAILHSAGLQGADLRFANLTDANLTSADLTGSRLFGASAWRVGLDESTRQGGLIITDIGEPEITVDDVEAAQFSYLLLRNDRIRDLINTIGRKNVLLLGRFTQGRIAILERLREELRKRGYVPIIFNIDKQETNDFTGTVRRLAGLSHFVIADITNPKSAPFVLQATVPEVMVPFQPIIEAGEEPFAMLQDLWINYRDWVFEPLYYSSLDALVGALDDKIIRPAEVRFAELLARKAEKFKAEYV